LFKVLSLLMLGLAAALPSASRAAEVDDLAASTTWLKLGHYERAGQGFRSDIESDGFFLDPNGRTDPAAELSATVRALALPAEGDNASHAQCRFPARYLWLKRRSTAVAALPAVNCAAYDDWSQRGAITGVSLVFVSGRLTNPATYYGHILLKFNAPQNAQAAGLLDTSLNYGATFPPNENGVVYLVKGIAGGYPSSFTNLAFYNHSNRYGETELRTLWEYELALDPWQVQFLVAHAWELMAKDNRYFFLKQNCAYRMAELANLVVEEPLLPRSKAWAAPVDVFTRLMQARQDGRPLVRHVRRLPSRQAQFRDRLDALSPRGREALEDFIAGPPPSYAAFFQPLPAPERAKVMEALIDYYAFVEIKDAEAAAEAVRTQDRLLLARLALPPSAEPAAEREAAPPHLGQRSSMVQLSAVSNNRRGDGIEARFRGAHHDFLTYAPGVPPNSELTLLDVRVAARGSRISLEELEVARITNLNISETGLPGDGGKAWRLQLGARSARLDCERCLEAYVEGGLGKGVDLSRDIALYGFLNGRLAAGDGDAIALAGPSVGLLFGPGKTWRGNLEARLWQELDGERDARPSASLNIRFGGAARWDFRTGLHYERAHGVDTTEFRAGLAAFW
jgi:hypothetical protein